MQGRIVRIAPNEYSIDDPEAAKVIFRARDQLEKAQWYHVFTAPGEPEGVFAIRANGKHNERRRQVNEFYTTNSVHQISYRIDDVSRLFFKKLANRATSEPDTSFDLCQMIKFYAYDALANLTFGQVFGCLENYSDVNELIKTVATFVRYGMVVGVFVEWHPVIIRLLQALTPGGNKGLLHLVSIGERAIKDMDRNKSEDHEEAHRGPHSFIGMMQEKHLREPATFTQSDVTYHMIPNIVAGSDTTAASLNAAVYLLWRHPSVLARLRQELDKWAAGKEKRTMDSMIFMAEAQDLPYLQAVIKESMRLFPGLGNNYGRVVPKEGLVIADQFFPAGTVVGMNAYAAHANRDVLGLTLRNSDLTAGWTMKKKVTRMDQYFLSFGRGPRNCIGRNIALTMLNTLIPELVLRFDFMPVNPNQSWTVYDDTFMYQEDFQVKVRERSAGNVGTM
ncbi:MAG: hypothetical protein Q9169_006945 [Polycauliona sp. 2 TL-2023]